jgi:putative addiction module component (TIGR02574 family)
MTATLTPEGLAKLSVDERLKLIEMIWSSLSAEAHKLPVPQWQREIIRERIAQFRANPNLGTDAEEFLDSLGRGE